jgi:hypothetical protein
LARLRLQVGDRVQAPVVLDELCERDVVLDELRDLDAALARVDTTATAVDIFRYELTAIVGAG